MSTSKKYFFSLLCLQAMTLLFTGCDRSSSNTVWEDNQSITRRVDRRSKAVFGKEGDSQYTDDTLAGPMEEEFIPLQADDLKGKASDDLAFAQPEDFMSNGSGLSIDMFREPNDQLAAIFKRVHFNTDDYVLRKKEYYATINQIADYLKKNPNTYVFMAGHCDSRGSEAYNLALGTRRANSIRNLLIKRGVDSTRLYTISYGKEKPLDLDSTREAWSKNRRVEFKLYAK